MFTGHLLHEFEGQREKKTCFLKVAKKIKSKKCLAYLDQDYYVT
jgi:hypothetical protein